MKTKVAAEELEQHMENDDGLCLECGTWTEGGVEPDAEGYECPSCALGAVVGAEQAVIMDVVEVFS